MDIKDETPFSKPLEEYKNTSLSQIFGVKDKLVRETNFNLAADPVENISKKIMTTQQLKEELSAQYHIQSPNMQFIIGEPRDEDPLAKDEKQATVYVVTDKVRGESFGEVDFTEDELPEVGSKLEELLSNLITYHQDKF